MEETMERPVFCGIAMLFSVISLFSQTSIMPGDVSGTWGILGSPYLITGDVTIPDDSTLIIEPGVSVEFQGYYALNVQGRLLAIGTPMDTISFTINDTTGFHNPDTTLGGWNGIQFIDTPQENDTSKIQYCRLEYGKAVGSNPPESNGGAVYISNFHNVLITNCLITHNSAGGLNSPSGGGLSLFFSNVQLENNEISYNRAWDGGAIIIFESDAVFWNNRFVSNHADAGGGGLWIGGQANPEFNGDIFLNNRSESNGGGIICWQTTNTTLNDVSFTGNLSNWGGGVGVIDCQLQMNNCSLVDNFARDLGGGLAADFSTVHLSNTTFLGDTSGFLSGAIHSWYSDMQIKNSLFEDNSAQFGGAIHSEFSDFQIDSSAFRRNLAIDGAGIHSSNTSYHLDSCLFVGNRASNDGGGIQYHVDTTEFTSPYELQILNSRFIQNEGFRRGALDIQQINLGSSMVNVFIDNSEFIENVIDRGGNLFIGRNIEDFIISRTVFRGNSATLRTASCQISNNATGTVSNCLFVSNQNPGGGSAFTIGLNSNIALINNTFFDNAGGAALTVRNAGHAMLLNNIFWKNRPYNIIISAVNDTTPCSADIYYNDFEFGQDSIIVNDTISTVNWGGGNLDQNPLFADTSGLDFHLQDTSACIGAGIDSLEISGVWYYSPISDLEGNVRPDPAGSMPDMGAYESPLAVPTILPDVKIQNPLRFSLEQNYPNPFNQTTVISYQLSAVNRVSLQVYDIAGREVAELVNGTRKVGEHTVKWNASNLASGIYFYRLVAGPHVQTRKMVVLK
jgi:hypothetical protein